MFPMIAFIFQFFLKAPSMTISKIWPFAYVFVDLCACLPVTHYRNGFSPINSRNLPSSSTSNLTSSDQNFLFSSANVSPSYMALTFLSSVPVAVLLNVLVVKFHGRLHRSQHQKSAEFQRAKLLDKAGHAQWKSELEGGAPRHEVHGDDLRHEKSDEDEIKEMPYPIGELSPSSYRGPHEVEGEGHSGGELEAPL